MNGIKDMLFGLAIILATIAFHLFIADRLWTDCIAILGLIVVFVGYFKKEE